MKKITTIMAIAAMASASQAVTLTMTDWNSNVADGNVNEATEDFTFTVPNATFTLTVTTAAGTLTSSSTSNLTVSGPGGNDGRIESSETPITISLSVAVDAGFQLDSLALDWMKNGSWNGGTSADWTQTAGGGSTQTVVYPSNINNYTNFTGIQGTSPEPIETTLSGLTALSAGNVGGAGDGTWDLAYKTIDGTGVMTTLQQQIGLDYTISAIPEPGAASLLGLWGAMFLMRRRRD